jgi:glycosyltransferase 2 family protein
MQFFASPNVAIEAANPPARGRLQTIAIFIIKLAVTAGCFWYVLRRIELTQALARITELDSRWAAFAILVVALQIPLVALRWRRVLRALAVWNAQITRGAMIVITAIGLFFGQVLPSVAGEGIRAWLLVRLGVAWRDSVISLVIDRAIAVMVLLAIAFLVLCSSAGLLAFGDYRKAVLLACGALLAGGILGLLLLSHLAPFLQHWRYSRWIGVLATDAVRVLFGPQCLIIFGLSCLIHALTVLVVWSISRAQGLMLTIPDAAVLFTVMVGVNLLPISISGWGLREVAVVSLLGSVAPERALLLSVCFGLVVAIGSLPGALAWLVYSPGLPAQAIERSG